MKEAIKDYDMKVIWGHRGEKAQGEAFAKGVSKRRWPNSDHNTIPATAIDVAPWPLDWTDTNRFYFMAGHILAHAERLGIQLRWGGDWDSDRDFSDQSFNDLGHFELLDIEAKKSQNILSRLFRRLV